MLTKQPQQHRQVVNASGTTEFCIVSSKVSEVARFRKESLKDSEKRSLEKIQGFKRTGLLDTIAQLQKKGGIVRENFGRSLSELLTKHGDDPIVYCLEKRLFQLNAIVLRQHEDHVKQI